MVVPPPQDQDRGIAHCHYIRQLANEIWCKENDKGRKLGWNDCVRKAFQLHRKKLILSRVSKLG